MRVSRLGFVVVAVAICGAACGNDATEAAAAAAAASESTSAPADSTTTVPVGTTTAPLPFACPITMPPVPGLAVPEPYPEQPSRGVWYGTEELWTVLEPDGSYLPRKGVFWSANFPGGDIEERPDLQVTWRRLDQESPPITEGAPGTNAYTPGEGWFMMAGIDPEEGGCWEVTATYGEATLSYVYLRP